MHLSPMYTIFLYSGRFRGVVCSSPPSYHLSRTYYYYYYYQFYQLGTRGFHKKAKPVRYVTKDMQKDGCSYGRNYHIDEIKYNNLYAYASSDTCYHPATKKLIRQKNATQVGMARNHKIKNTNSNR